MDNMRNLIHFEAEEADGQIRNFYYDPDSARIYTDDELDNEIGEYPEQRLLSYSKRSPGPYWKITRWKRFKLRLRMFIDAKMPYFLRRWIGRDRIEAAIEGRELDANDNHVQLIEIQNRERLGKMYTYIEEHIISKNPAHGDINPYDGEAVAKKFKAFAEDEGDRDEGQADEN